MNLLKTVSISAVGLALLSACSNDNFEPQSEPQQGDLYMSLTINQASSPGSRADDTKTPNQGVEVGQSTENTISTAVVVFTKENSGNYKVFKTIAIGPNDISKQDQKETYDATFLVDREAFKSDIQSNGTDNEGQELDYYIFVVANPDVELATKFTANGDVQQTFSLETDGNRWWADNHFLMSNAKLVKKTMRLSDISTGYNTSTDAYSIGSVDVQRAMSRIDLDVSDKYITFSSSESTGSSSIPEVTLTIDAVALVNQATTASLFKVTNADNTGWQSPWNLIKFDIESATNYVLSPVQTAYSLPLFGTRTNAPVTSGVLTGTQDNFENLFAAGQSFTTIEDIKSATADNTFTYPNSDTYDQQGNYHIWRYCMENTNYDAANQLRGNTTGVVFRAEITGAKISATSTDDAIYAYNNVILGKATDLKTYATGDKSADDSYNIYEMVAINYQAAVNAYIADEESGDSDFDLSEATTQEDLKVLDSYLVKQGFSIYRPTLVGSAYKYYCYYVYWNRHNNNGSDSEMGPMEFATVRNNVYKLAVTSLINLGHPAIPADDPDTEKPTDGAEKDKFYCTVSCVVLPWEVRLNNIVF